MKWNIFDPKNEAVLKMVGISNEQLNKLRLALELAQQKVKAVRSLPSETDQPNTGPEKSNE